MSTALWVQCHTHSLPLEGCPECRISLDLNAHQATQLGLGWADLNEWLRPREEKP